MPTKERKYKGSMTLGKLEIACEAEEQAYGNIIKLEALGGWSVATYDNAEFPPLQSLAILPQLGDMPPPAPAHATHLFDGTATALGVEMPVSVYRTS
jgi:hypothetical protein